MLEIKIGQAVLKLRSFEKYKRRHLCPGHNLPMLLTLNLSGQKYFLKHRSICVELLVVIEKNSSLNHLKLGHVPDATPVVEALLQIPLSAVDEDILAVPEALVSVSIQLSVEPNGTVLEPGLVAGALQRFGPRPDPGERVRVVLDALAVVEVDVERVVAQLAAHHLSVALGEPRVAHRHPLQGGAVEVLEEALGGIHGALGAGAQTDRVGQSRLEVRL
jgi:hypothetical protein